VYGLDEDGKEERHLVQVKRNVLENELHAFGRAFESIIYDIEVDGVKTRVLPRCLQLHPLTNLPVSVNFLRYWDGCPRRKVKIPVTYYNQEKCLGIRRGGLLDAKMRDLDAWVSGPWIPPRLEVNLDGLRLGHKILAEHLELPEGVEPVRQKDLLSMISGKKSLMREEAKEQAEAEAAAA
jgi:large subunit ribosomal protein L25